MSAISVTQNSAIPRVLTIAGTDPTGGAGIQADIKAITAAGGFAYSVVTALVAQNTTGVQEISTPPVDFLRTQLRSVADDVAIDAIKVGMLGSIEVIDVVAEFLDTVDCPVIIDPVMIASSGDRLLAADAEAAVRDFAARADIVTPNLPEMAVLLGTEKATDFDAAIAQAKQLAARLDAQVLMKGGHFTGDRADNALVTPTGEVTHFAVPRVDTSNTHGTDCSLSSALATKVGAGLTGAQAARWASRWLHESILNADGLHIGAGHGPVDHSHTARRMQKAADARPWAPSAATPLPAAAGPAGPFTQRLWEEAGGAYLAEIMELPFITQLGRGTLPREDFLFYLAQDALYLRRYAQALRLLGGQWAVDADGAIADEQEMQRTWLDESSEQRMSPITRAYTDNLVAAAATEPAAVGQAAILPCYWLYYEVGVRLAAQDHPEHPYHSWLATYAGEEFETSTRAAIARLEQTLAANPELADAALEAFRVASHFEVDFFDQPNRAWVVTD